MGVAHALNNIVLQTIAHGVGSYIKRHRRMARHCRANSNFIRPDQAIAQA